MTNRDDSLGDTKENDRSQEDMPNDQKMFMCQETSQESVQVYQDN